MFRDICPVTIQWPAPVSANFRSKYEKLCYHYHYHYHYYYYYYDDDDDEDDDDDDDGRRVHV